MKFEPSELQELARAISGMVSETVIEGLRPLLTPKNGQVIDGLLDVKGISEYLKVSKTEVYKRIRENRIPYRRIGRGIRFKKEEVDAYFDSKKGVTNEEVRFR